MTTVDIIYYTHKKNNDGTSPVIVQIIINRKISRRSIINLLPSQWDADKKRVKTRSHPNYAAINVEISDEYNRIEKLIISGEFDLQRDFITYFKNKKSGPISDTDIECKLPSFASVVEKYLLTLNSGYSILSYESKLRRFIDVVQLGNLPTSRINKEHIDIYYQDCLNRKNGNNTIRTNLKVIRYASSFAEREGLDKRSEDLHRYKLPKVDRALKRKLTKDELDKFVSHDFKNKIRKSGESNKYDTREVQDMFQLQVCLRGMRIGDLIQLKQEYFVNGRLTYISNKNEKLFNIKLVPDALAIVNKYLDGREYLFTFYNWVPDSKKSKKDNLKEQATHVKQITAAINGNLKRVAKDAGIDKNVSTHIARHTFAKMAIDKLRDTNVSMDLLGHSSLKDHENYIRELSIDDELDAATDDIFS